MYTVSKALSLIMMICAGSSAAICPKVCACRNKIITCQGNVLKEAIPEGTIEANLTDFQPEPSENLSKVHETWSTVKKMNIILKFPSNINYLAGRCFEGLINLTFLGIHGINPQEHSYFYFNSETFYGLNNVKTLDLSRNPFLFLTEVTKSLHKTNILPNLKVIILKNVQTLNHKPVYRKDSGKLLEALQTRRIEELILDGVDFEIDFSYMRKLCKSLKVVSMRYSRVFAIYKADHFACSSLKVLDLTNASLPFLQFFFKIPVMPTPKFVSTFNRYASFVFSVETLSLNNFLSRVPEPLSFDNGLTFDTTGINLKVKYLNFRNNFLKNFNVSFQHMPFPPRTEIDVSNNIIEYINPKSIDPGKSIRKINLANNKLFKMERDYPAEFATFLHIFTDLEDISLAYNNIVSLPRHIFSKNCLLKTLDISGNKLHSLFIDMQPLSNLQYIDASGNRLTRLNTNEMIGLEKHALNYETFGRNSSFVLNIAGNNFKCECEKLSFVRSFKRAAFLSGRRNQYFCIYDDKKYDMKGDAFEQIANECNLKQLKRNLIIGLSVSSFLILTTVLSVILFRRHRKKQNKIKAYLSYVRKKDDNHFIAFLSYCSEDTGFVLSQLANKLNDEVCIRAKRQADYICIGDKHFRPGFPVITEIMSKMENSAVAIFVISQTFCDKSWCHIEVKEAMDLQKPVILIFKEEVDEKDMPKLIKRLFRQNTRCKFVQEPNGEWKLQPSWDVLTMSLIELAAGFEHIV